MAGVACLYAAAVLGNLPPVLAAILTVAAQILMTGALHEDGLADVCDGFGGGRTREEKLEIMRDSRLGTYGAIGLMLSLALRIGAIGAIAHPEAVAAGLIAAAALSRAAMPAAMWLLPQARPEGLAASAGRPRRGQALLGVGLGVVVSFLCLPFVVSFTAILVGLVVTGLMLNSARRQIGGITGDVLGGQQQLLDLACLAVVVATASSHMA